MPFRPPALDGRAPSAPDLVAILKGRARRPALTTSSLGVRPALEPVYDLFEATLGCNRDELVAQTTLHGLMPMQEVGPPNRPISPQPEGQASFRAVCGVALLANSRAIGSAPRLAAHPEKRPAWPQIDRKQALMGGADPQGRCHTTAIELTRTRHSRLSESRHDQNHGVRDETGFEPSR